MSPPRPSFPRPFRWGLVGVVAALIAYWSLVTAPPSLETAWSTTASSASRQGVVPGIPASYVRHALAYAGFGLTLAFALDDHEASTARKAAVVFLVATGYGVLMECGQWFHPDRVAALADVAANAVGAASSLSWYGLECRVRESPSSRRGRRES